MQNKQKTLFFSAATALITVLGIAVVFSLLIASSSSSSYVEAYQQHQQRAGGGRQVQKESPSSSQSFQEASKPKIKPSSTSLAHSFKARMSPSGSDFADENKNKNNQNKRKNRIGEPPAETPEFREAWNQLASGNTTAVNRLQELAAAADGHAMMLLGVLYSSGVAVPRDEARSKLYHTFAALSYVSESVLITMEGEEDANNNCEGALPLARRAADVSATFNSDGSITPRWDASRLTTLEHREATQTENEIEVQLLLAERGNGAAACSAGYAYLLGIGGVEQDALAAQTYFEKGIVAKEPACFSGMGQLYARGVSGGKHPVGRDVKLAEKYYEQGAKLNHAASLNGLGYLYASGALAIDGERDFATALKYFEQSAALNNAPGIYNVGLLYLNGKGTRQDFRKAKIHLEKAASFGSMLATYQLGHVYAVGAGATVERNCNRALYHYKQVHRLGPWNLRWNFAREALRNNKPGEALLHYLILGALGKAKASQNAMFVIERFFDDFHPLVSFNGSVGNMKYLKDFVDTHYFDQYHLQQQQQSQQSQVSASSSSSSSSSKQKKDNSLNVFHALMKQINQPYKSVILHQLVLDAAKHGSADAKLDLASHYWDGVGTKRNRVKAREVYQAAADGGNVEAMYTLGWLHSTVFNNEDEEEDDLSTSSENAKNNINDEKEKEKQQQENDFEEEYAYGGSQNAYGKERRKRRISPQSSSEAAELLEKQNSNNNNNNKQQQQTHQQKLTRSKRDIHLAKRNYDQVKQMFPAAWFAVQVALLRLNFLWWYDYYFVEPAAKAAAAETEAMKRLNSGQHHQKTFPITKNSEQISQSSSASATTTTRITKTMNLRQTYFTLRRLALDLFKTVDPIVGYGLTLTEFFIVVCMIVLGALLLIRHHAFGV